MEFTQASQAHRGLLAPTEGDYVAPAAADTYFANEPNLIAPFDFDYDMITDFTTKLRYVKERRKSLCGLPCTDKGRESKTVPYDKITDCDVQEPAGMACCCCIQSVLSTVHIDTASSGAKTEGGGVRHELELIGLMNPNAFKHSVWAMKRRIAPPGASVPLTSAGTLSAPAQTEMATALLTEIRDELKTLNQQIREQKS